MADLRNYQSRAGAQARTQAGAVIDEGLRAYMLRVYNLMALGLAITGFAALGTIMVTVTNDRVVCRGHAEERHDADARRRRALWLAAALGRDVCAARDGLLDGIPHPEHERVQGARRYSPSTRR